MCFTPLCIVLCYLLIQLRLIIYNTKPNGPMSKYGNDIKSLNEYSLVLTKPTVIHNYGNKPYFPLWILFDFFFFLVIGYYLLIFHVLRQCIELNYFLMVCLTCPYLIHYLMNLLDSLHPPSRLAESMDERQACIEKLQKNLWPTLW